MSDTAQFFPVPIPQVHANEDECVVVELFVKETEAVKKGQKLCTVETTKSTLDLLAEQDGYVRGLQFKAGEEARAGGIFCYLTSNLKSPFPEHQDQPIKKVLGLKATKKALELIDTHQITPEQLPKNQLIKEKDVLALLGKSQSKQPKRSITTMKQSYPQNAILLIGTGGHAGVCIDLIRSSDKFEIAGLVVPDSENEKVGTVVNGIPIIGCDADLSSLRKRGIPYAVNAVGAIGDGRLRAKIYQALKTAGFELPALIHKDATVEKTSTIGPGAQIMAKAVVASNAQIYENVLVNTAAVVSHDCVIKAHTHVSPGAILGGFVEVGERSLIGMGTTVYFGLHIGSDVIVRNGIHIFANVPSKRFLKS